MKARVVLRMAVLAVAVLVSGSTGVQAALEPPVLIEATYVESSKVVDLRWSPVRGAVAYNVYRSESSGKDRTLIGTVSSDRYLDQKVAAGVTYYYTVTYLSSGFLESPLSEEWAVGGDAPGAAREGDTAPSTKEAPHE